MEEKTERPATKTAARKGPNIKERLKKMGNIPAQDIPARMLAVELRVALLEGQK